MRSRPTRRMDGCSPSGSCGVEDARVAKVGISYEIEGRVG
jgi:hypothetical protein